MTSPTPNPVRVLVIGAGTACELLHLPVLARLRDRGDLVLTAICDLAADRAQAAQKRFGFAEARSDAVTALERADIDAVYIFASAQLHYEYGLRALENGKHLFVEKPIAPSYAQVQTLAQTARERGLVAVGGHNRRFCKAVIEARHRAGKASWQFAEAIFHKPEGGKPPLFGAKTWLSANGIHALDALIFAMDGLPDHLAVLSGTIGSAEPNAFSALMRWPSGSQGTFLCNNNAGIRCEEYVFHAPGETYRITESDFVIAKGKAVSKKPLDPPSASFAAEHASFLEAIREGTDPPHSVANLAPSLFLTELIERGSSGPVHLPQTAPAISRLPRRAAGKSILVVKPDGLQAALVKALPDHRLLSVEDVSGPDPDVAGAILGHGAPPLATELLDKLPNLSVVGIQALSLSRYQPEALQNRGIALVNASSAYAESVAEFAFALAVLGRRRAFGSHELMRRGGWGTGRSKSALHEMAKAARSALQPLRLEPFFLRLWKSSRFNVNEAQGAGELNGATVGLIGWGANARAFAERLKQAGSHVQVYSEHATDVPEAMRVSLAEALAADIVSLHRGLTSETRHFLGATELARLRPGSVLINVARGGLIEPRALLARLKQGDVFACLDTYEEEPLAASHPLRRLPNVFLTSHIAGGSRDMHAAAAEEIVTKVLAHLEGGRMGTVSMERLRTMT